MTTPPPSSPPSVPPHAPWWRRTAALDPAVALTLFGLTLLGVLAAERLPDIELAVSTPVWLGLSIGVSVPLAWRRRAPVVVLGIVTVAFSAFRLAEIPEVTMSSVALFLALYTVGAQLPPERSRLPRAVAISVMAALVTYQLATSPVPLVGFDLVVLLVFSVVLNLAFFAAAWALGDVMWRRRRSEAALVDHASELARSREALARRAVQDERVRIARELHDVVAHHVSVMGIQAGAARRAIEGDPARAAEALSSVEQASRDAVSELHQLLAFLRSDDDGAAEPVAPQPSLGELDDLADTVRETGLEVTVAVEGDRRQLPDSVELSAYRIIQEALTNTMKHAESATRADVRLRFGDDRLEIVVRDDGPAAQRVAPDDPGGRGVIGMRERALLHGGELVAGARRRPPRPTLTQPGATGAASFRPRRTSRA